jgi:tRNA threonylcarbamoyladenosine biosynthesis protein TsaE
MNATENLKIDLPDEAATLALGALVARGLQPGLNIYLSGELGAGKTTFVRGLLRELGFEGRVKSPTYALVELYVISRLNLYHFDFYRFRDPEEWHEAGFRDLFSPSNICLVEWPEKARDLLPTADISITLITLISVQTAGTEIEAPSRQAILKANSMRGQTVLTSLQHSSIPLHKK